MNKLQQNYKNIIIFFITAIINFITINNICEITNLNYKVTGIVLYSVLSVLYIIACINDYSILEKIIRIVSIGIALISVTSIIVFYVSKIMYIIKHLNLQNILSKYKNKAVLIYFLISFLQPIALPLPEPITVMAGSSVLGSFNGAAFGFLGTVLGIIAMYFFIRATGARFIEKFVTGSQIEKFNDYVKKNEFLVILSLFILPILPDEAICIGAGLMKINPYKFISVAIISKVITAFSLSYSVQFIKLNSMHIALIISVIFIIKKLIDMKKAKSVKQS
ncbi:MAG: VTT domain-containing protein [Clostridium sp.]|nr:VTT domain-containing protein [Clostridium sp.]